MARLRDRAIVVVLGGALVTAGVAAAATIDSSFGPGGVGGAAGTGLVAIPHEVRSLAKDSSGRFYAVGSPASRAVGITRLSAAGVIDTTFGNGGTVTSLLGQGAATAFASAVDSSDRVVVVGFTGLHGYVARFLPSGVPDPAFGSGGVTILPDVPGATLSSAVAVGVDGQNRVLALEAGTTGLPVYSQTLRVIRLTAAGSIDSSYGTAGVATAAPVNREPAAIAVTPDGHVTVSGSTSTSISTVGIVRLGPDGQPDASFGAAGVASATVPGVFGVSPFGIDLDPSGRVVIAGNANRFGPAVGLVLRLDLSGSLDATFANGGIQIFDDGPYTSPSFIGVDATANNITLAGYTSFYSSLPALYAGRLNTDGSFDQTFGANGRFTSKTSSNFARAVLAADGVVVAGYVADPASTGFITRLAPSTADVTAPTLTLPPDITAEATSPAGAAVPFTGLSVNDAGDPSVELVCSYTSGSVFPLGIRIIACRAVDRSGNTAQGIFRVTVVDRTPPTVTVPADIVRTTGAAPVTFTASASDAVDGTIQPTCTPASGSTFPLGRTTVTCTATDQAGNPGTATFAVTVSLVDQSPPTLTLPPGISVDASSAQGAIVTFTASATDATDGPTPVICSPASGTRFAIGDTTVTCTSTDRAGNTASGTFVVHVKTATVAPPGGGGGTSGGGGGGGLPDLELTQSADRLTAAIGDAVTFTSSVVLKNFTASSGASNLVLTDVLPSNVEVVSVSTNRGSCTRAQTVVCNLDFLASGMTASVQVTVKVTGGGEIASVSTVRADETELDPSNNTATARVNPPAPLTPPTPPRQPATAKGLTKQGSSRADILRGTSKADTLDGRGGDDRIFGYAGADFLVGGLGRDHVTAGAGNDTIRARDRTRDVIDCGPGTDTATADPTDDLTGCERVLRG